MAMRRTVMRLAERNDIHPALKKLWKKHYDVDGQIVRHLSPFEQKIVSPMFKDAFAKTMKKFIDFMLEAGPGLGLGLAVFFWGDYKHKDIAFHHRT